MPVAVRRALLSVAQFAEADAGKLLYRQQQMGTKFYVLLRGQAEVIREVREEAQEQSSKAGKLGRAHKGWKMLRKKTFEKRAKKDPFMHLMSHVGMKENPFMQKATARAMHVCFLSPGDSFGEYALDFGFGERRATVMTVAESEFLVISRKAVQQLMEKGLFTMGDLPLHHSPRKESQAVLVLPPVQKDG